MEGIIRNEAGHRDRNLLRLWERPPPGFFVRVPFPWQARLFSIIQRADVCGVAEDIGHRGLMPHAGRQAACWAGTPLPRRRNAFRCEQGSNRVLREAAGDVEMKDALHQGRFLEVHLVMGAFVGMPDIVVAQGATTGGDMARFGASEVPTGTAF